MAELGLAVAFGIVSLLPTAVSVADALRYISSARFKDSDSAGLLTTLLLQQSRYYCWFIDMGFESARTDADLLGELSQGHFGNAPIQRIVLQTLQQITNQLSELAGLLEKHQIQGGPDPGSDIHPLAQARAFVLSDAFWELQKTAVRHDETSNRAMGGSKSPRTWFRAIKNKAAWTVTDRDRFTDGVNRFREQIDVLVWLCDRTRRALEPQTGQPSRIASSLSSTAQYNQLRISIKEPDDPLLAFATFQQNRASWQEGAMRRHLREEEWAEYGSTTARTLLSSGALVMYVEWSSFPEKHTIDDRPRLLKRLDEVVAPLNSMPRLNIFSVLHCTGYDYNWALKKYALIFDTPPSANPTSKPISLADYIQATSKPGHKPDLGARFELASRLAGILLKLHAAGLLHKDFRSQNVVFFPANSASRQINLGSPFVVNFQYTRSSYGASDIILKYGDVGRYRHPLYQGIDMAEEPSPNPQGEDRELYRPEFDVYGLGVMLLEIAGWESLDAILGTEGMTADEVLTKLKQKTKQLSFRVGNIYQGVVSGCLTGSYAVDVTGEVGTKKRQETLNEALFWHIYQPLRGCAA